MSSRLGEFANIYELLDESADSSGVESGKKAKEAVEQKKAAAAAALAPAVTNKPVNNTQGQKPAGDRRSPRVDRPRQDGDRPPRAPRAEGDRPPRAPRAEGDRPPRAPRAEGDRPPRAPRAEGDRPPRRPRQEGGENSFAESGQAAAAGEPRPRLPRDQTGGPRPDRGYERRQTGDQDTRGKRVYERRSGTGRGKETAKGGSGKGNWGSAQDEAAAVEGETAAQAEAHAEGGAAQEGEKAATETAPAEATEATPAPADDEPAVRTMAEFLASRKTGAALPAARQAGEGEDSKAYAAYQPMKKSEESFFAVEKVAKDKKAKEATKETKESKEKKVSADQVLRIQEKPRDNREERGSRGGRGGRGGQQGGQRRGNNAGSSAPNFGDASAFPGLSTKA